MLNVIILVSALALFLFRTYRLERRALHILQLEGYRNVRFLRWVRSNWSAFFELKQLYIFALLTIGLFFIGTSSALARTFTTVICFLSWVILEIARTRAEVKIRVKKPLVITWRARRIIFVTLIVVISGTFALLLLLCKVINVGFNPSFQTTQLFLFAGFIFTLFVPYFVVVANLSLTPVEKSLQFGYLLLAKKKFNSINPLVVGITGSFGKTTTKHIVGAVLNTKFNTLITPHSYNSLMGVTKTIRENLKPEHEVFVVEMGAYAKGDIKELCNLVPPRIGILTAIGPQHLERFGSIEMIEETKSELLQAIPKDGFAIINISDPRCQKLAIKFNGCRVVRIGLGVGDEDVYVEPNTIQYSLTGMSFQVNIRDRDSFKLSSKLLGKHNLTNILCAVAIGLELGINIEEIQKAIRRMEFIPHRLQLIPFRNGITLIDDTYNSNPIGFKNALEVLEGFNSGARILVTPGMVELGELENEENRKIGEIAANICSFVVLVGTKLSVYLKDGLLAAGFPENKIKVVKDFAEAQKIVSQIAQPKDIVLMENDLPDNY